MSFGRESAMTGSSRSATEMTLRRPQAPIAAPCVASTPSERHSDNRQPWASFTTRATGRGTALARSCGAAWLIVGALTLGCRERGHETVESSVLGTRHTSWESARLVLQEVRSVSVLPEFPVLGASMATDADLMLWSDTAVYRSSSAGLERVCAAEVKRPVAATTALGDKDSTAIMVGTPPALVLSFHGQCAATPLPGLNEVYAAVRSNGAWYVLAATASVPLGLFVLTEAVSVVRLVTTDIGLSTDI